MMGLASPSRQVFHCVVISLCGLLLLAEGQRLGCSYFKSPKELSAETYPKEIRMPPSDYRYKSNQHCEWEMKTNGEKNQVIKLEIEIDVQGPNFYGECVADYLDIYDGNSHKRLYMGRVCGKTKKTFVSTTSGMVINFISDAQFEFTGFHLSYLAVLKASKEDETISNGLVYGLSAGLVVLFIIVLLIFFLRHKLSSKLNLLSSPRNRTPQARNAASRLQLQPQLITEETTTPPPELRGEHPATLTPSSGVSHSYVQNIPLRVSLPDRRMSVTNNQVLPNQGIRSETPPPSYDYLIQHEGLRNPHDIPTPLSPPDYETVIKEDETAGTFV